jgi:hypothetical protein
LDALGVEPDAILDLEGDDLTDAFDDGFDRVGAPPEEVDVSREARVLTRPGHRHQPALQHETLGVWRAAEPVQEPLHRVERRELLEGAPLRARPVEQALSDRRRRVGHLAIHHPRASR